MKKYFINGLGQNLKIKGCETLKVDFNKQTLKIRKADVLISFSLGSLIAVNEANRLGVKTLILCSPTPILFDPNLLKIERLVLICGEKENLVSFYLKDLSKKFKGQKKIEIIEGEDHKITKKYSEVIEKYI